MKKYIPSLNGLRALSIILVIIFHIDQKNFDNYIYNKWALLVDGQLGVNVFFVLSGFLITNLLLAEESATGSISFKGFYLKRIFRIFPVYYTLLAVYLILQLLNILDFSAASWLTSITYTKYFNWHSDWETGHLWSLSIEEQFYFVWPFVFKFARKYRSSFAFGIIALIPVLRMVYTYTHIDWLNELTIFQRVDAIMWGCVFAIYHEQLLAFIRKITGRYKLLILLPFLALPVLDLMTHLNHTYNWHLGFFIVSLGGTTGTIADIAIGCIMLISIHYTNNLWFKFLNTPVMNYIGKLSYSLYIWQQLFFSDKIGSLGKFPLNVVLIIIVANISFYVIEKPFLKLKSKFGLE